MKTTLKDISDVTGLSISTISRVLSGKAKRNSNNVKAILDAAKKLNYPIYLDTSSELYEQKDVILIALITHIHIGEFYSSFFEGFSDAEKNSRFKIGMFNVEQDVNSILDLILNLSTNSYDGAILFLPHLNEIDYSEIVDSKPQNFKLVSAASTLNPVIDTVTFDFYRGGYLVAKHFFEMGYKNVGKIMGTATRNESLLRKSGFTDFVEHHSDMNLIWQVEGDYTIDSGKKLYQEYKNLDIKPEAIFISNDYMCLGFMEYAREDGVRIPEDVALVGFDDLPICEFHYPKISSVNTSYHTLGESALDVLSQKFEQSNSEQIHTRIVPVTLSVRSSSKTQS